jgi:hypothetical protein
MLKDGFAGDLVSPFLRLSIMSNFCDNIPVKHVTVGSVSDIMK